MGRLPPFPLLAAALVGCSSGPAPRTDRSSSDGTPGGTEPDAARTTPADEDPLSGLGYP